MEAINRIESFLLIIIVIGSTCCLRAQDGNYLSYVSDRGSDGYLKSLRIFFEDRTINLNYYDVISSYASVKIQRDQTISWTVMADGQTFKKFHRFYGSGEVSFTIYNAKKDNTPPSGYYSFEGKSNGSTIFSSGFTIQ